MKVGILHIHGMGQDKMHSHVEIIKNIKEHLNEKIELEVAPFLYYQKMQKNQEIMINRYKDLRMQKVRKFALGSLGDVAGLGYHDEIYKETMNDLKNTFEALNSKIMSGPIIVIAHSLGCQLFSCFMWDEAKSGYTSNYKMLKRLFTTGNNMPIFVSGLPQMQIKPFPNPCNNFKWINFWANTDVLGYPLNPLSPNYSKVEDVKVNSFWPFISHTNYDEKKQVYTRIADEINKLIQPLLK